MTSDTTVRPGKRLPSARMRLASVFVLMALVFIGIVLSVFYVAYRNQLRVDIKERLLNIAALAASQQDGDAFITIRSQQDPAFEAVRLQNLSMRATIPDIAFLYTLRYDPGGLYFVVDAIDPNDPDASAYGDRYLEPGPVLEANYRSISGPLVEENIYTDEYGSFLSAYAPFYTSSGQLAGIVGVDFRADEVIATQRRALVLALTTLLIALPVVALIGWLVGNQLSKPIRVFTDLIVQISRGAYDYRPDLEASFQELAMLQEAAFSMADEINASVKTLEQRVQERTSDLERRSGEIMTAAQVVRDVSLAQNVEELLARTANLIRERFAYYHVGIFLVDENREFAILRAAGGEAGRLLLANKHKLRVGEVGIVGYVTKTGEPRIALDVGSDAIHFKNPLLPYTRSEMTLPLVVQGRILGAIDIQSEVVNAFDAGDIAILQILADQLSVALEKTRLIEESAQNTLAMEAIAREYTARTWKSYMRQAEKVSGYRFGGVTFEPLHAGSDLQLKDSRPRIESDASGSGKTLLVPVMLRNEPIGMLSLKFSAGEIAEETIRLVSEAASRLAIALENARLVDDARRLAQRERQVNLISAQLQQSTDLETLLKNTVRELGDSLGAPNTFIQIGQVKAAPRRKKKKA